MAKTASRRRQPPKRTRRVSQPFDDRLEVRCYKAEKAHLAAEAAKRGLTVGDLIRFQLGTLLGPGPAKATEPALAPPEEAPEPHTDLVAALSAGFDIRPGKAMLYVRLGKVSVGGEPWFHEDIPPDLLPRVTLDGKPLPLDRPVADVPQ